MSKQAKLDTFMKQLASKVTESEGEEQGLYVLPRGWKWIKLSEIAKVRYGKARPKESGNIPVVGSGGVYAQTRKPLVDFPTIVIGRKGTAGQVWFMNTPCWPSDTTFYLEWEDTSLIEPHFMFWYFKHIRPSGEKARTTLPSLLRHELENYFLPLPPINEQRCIVSRLEQLIGRVEEAKRLRKAAKQETEKIMQATLNKIFSKTEENGWKQIKIGEICKINPSIREIRNLPEDTKVTFVPMSAVNEVTGEIENPEIRLLREVRKGYTYFREGDVLFAKITPCMENGKSAIAKNLVNGIGFGSTEFHVLRPIKEKVTPEWIYYFIRQKSFRDEAARNMTGSVGQQRVPVQFLKNAKIPLPPLEEQKKAVMYLNKLKKTAEILRKLQFETEDELEKLVPAILDKAFRGQL